MTGLDPISWASANDYPGWEHAPACRCGRPWPCRGFSRERFVREQAVQRRERVRLITALTAGACMACGLPIEGRQPSVTFPGPNLWRPDLGDGGPFHTRRACRRAARSYESAWLAQWAGRPPLLSCPGLVVQHADGARECDYGACPGTGKAVDHETNHRLPCWYVWPVCPRCGDNEAAYRARTGDRCVVHGLQVPRWGDTERHAAWFAARRR